MFDGFATHDVDVGACRLHVRAGGTGPPVLLLHGHPRTHATWHLVAERLAGRFTVVCPDLRGYGRSGKPPSGADHSAYGKRAMALDCARLMTALGFARFAVAGHDRGAYVATRLALDHPDRITRLAVLDAVPIGEALARCGAGFARAWWHWFFLGQTDKPAEPLINADPDAWYRVSDKYMGAAAYADLRAALHDPATVHAMCEDYRAGLTVDRAADDADRAAGRRIAAPLLFVWAEGDDMHKLYDDPAGIWQAWADDVTEVGVASGHHMAEEAPDRLAALLARFFTG